METSSNYLTITTTLSDEWKQRALKGSWGMFTDEGSLMVGQTIVDIAERGVRIEDLKAGESIQEAFSRTFVSAVTAVVRPVHSEVTDTEVEDSLYDASMRIITG